MKVGDLVKPKPPNGYIGIIISIRNFSRWSRIHVLFPNGVFEMQPRNLEVI